MLFYSHLQAEKDYASDTTRPATSNGHKLRSILAGSAEGLYTLLDCGQERTRIRASTLVDIASRPTAQWQCRSLSDWSS